MAKRSALVRLDDLLQAIGDIETIVGRLDVQTFQADFVARLAIERCLEIISEASRHIPVRLTDNSRQFPGLIFVPSGTGCATSTIGSIVRSSGRPQRLLSRISSPLFSR